MPKTLETATDFIFWHKRLLDYGGLWPLDTRGIKFYVMIVYTLVHVYGAIIRMIQVFGEFGQMVEHVGESAVLLMIMTKIPTFKYSRSLRILMREIKASDDEGRGDSYKTEAEKKIYVSYSAKGLKFFKLTLRVAWITTGTLYVKPMIYFLLSEFFGDGHVMHVMPYQIYLVNITDIRVYVIVYIYVAPMIYVWTCQCILSCFMWSLVIHLCAELSVLAFRTKNIMTICSDNSSEQIESEFRWIIQKHNKIIETSKTLERIFRIFLLNEPVIVAVVVGVVMYIVLVADSDSTDALSLFACAMNMSALLLVTYGWCLIGDFLQQGSLNVFNAYYECEWYDMPLRCQKLIVICMIRAQNPLYISGGGFYIYSLASFTGVVKSAMGYSTMLRQVND